MRQCRWNEFSSSVHYIDLWRFARSGFGQNLLRRRRTFPLSLAATLGLTHSVFARRHPAFALEDLAEGARIAEAPTVSDVRDAQLRMSGRDQLALAALQAALQDVLRHRHARILKQPVQVPDRYAIACSDAKDRQVMLVEMSIDVGTNQLEEMA